MLEGARLVISHLLGGQRTLRRPQFDLNEELVYITNLAAPLLGPLRILGIVGEQMLVVFYMRPTTTRVNDDRI